MGENYNNSLDNSEVPHKNDENNTLPGFESERQARQFKLYLENLKLLAEFQSTEYNDKKIKIKIGKGSDGKDKPIVSINNATSNGSWYPDVYSGRPADPKLIAAARPC